MKKKILYTVSVFLISLFVVFLVLKNGIFISNFQFDFLKLEQLYIKLDKKLIVRAKNISFKENAIEENDTLKNEDKLISKEFFKIIKRIKYFYAFVEEIDIQNLNIKDNHARILFKRDEFFIDNDLFFLKLALSSEDKNIYADIKKLLVKDYDLNIDGNLTINTVSEFYYFKANASSKWLDFNASFSYKNGALAYKFEDVNIRNIEEIFTQVSKKTDISDELFSWITYKAKAQFYHLDYLQGFADFSKNNYYFDDISALGYAKNLEVRLDSEMNPIQFENVDLNLTKQNLYFDFNQAQYNGANLSSSKIYLYDLMNEEKSGIYIHILSDNLKLDSALKKALEQYVNIPLYQKNGKVITDLELKIDFNAAGSVYYNGKFLVENSHISLMDFNVEKAEVYINDGVLSIKNAKLNNSFLEALMNANINLKEKNGKFKLETFKVSLENELLNLSDRDLDVDLNYTQAIKINIPKFDLNMQFDQEFVCEIRNLSQFAPYSPLLKKITFQGGESLIYKSSNFDDFWVELKGVQFALNLKKKNHEPYNKDDFIVEKKQGNIQLSSASGLVHAEVINERKNIYFKDLTYYYKKEKDKSSIFDLEHNMQDIVVNASNIDLIMVDMNKTLSFDNFETHIQKNILQAKANKYNANFDLYYSPDNFSFVANNMDSLFINTFFQKQAVQEGIFNLAIKGSSLEFFEGKFELKNTYLKDLKGVNQLISFIDTVPSLLLFKTPTFNEKGLSINNGKIIFNRKKDLLSVEAINLNGDSVDIYGLGSVNLRLNVLDLNLELKTLKSASEAISKVPILNYVILGKNQEISTNIKIDGSIDDPQFHTQILSDTLKTPFNLIKNIIQLPVNIFK